MSCSPASLAVSSPDFTDRSRLTTLIQMCASELASSVADSGNSYAVMSSASALNPAAAIKEQFDGITQVKVLGIGLCLFPVCIVAMRIGTVLCQRS